MRAPWATLIQDVENGDTMIVNIELGRDNIALRDSRSPGSSDTVKQQPNHWVETAAPDRASHPER
jgi:hypothetical protein